MKRRIVERQIHDVDLVEDRPDETGQMSPTFLAPQGVTIGFECGHQVDGEPADVVEKMVRDEDGNWRQYEFADCAECDG